MNWETPRSLSSASSRRDREELHTHTGTPAEVPALRISRRMSSPVYLDRFRVHQDQVWNCGIRISPLPADESEGFASAQQVNQFKLEILLLQRPIEKEDVRAVVFNDKDAGGGTNRSVFQALPPDGQPSPAVLHHSTVDGGAVCGDTCLALTIHRLGAGPTKKKGNRSPASARSRRRGEYPYIVRLHNAERHNFVLEIAFSVENRISSLILKSFSGRKNVSRCPARPTLPGSPGSAVPGICPTARRESGFVDPFDDHHGKEQTWDLNAADQTVRRGGRRGLRGGGGLRFGVPRSPRADRAAGGRDSRSRASGKPRRPPERIRNSPAARRRRQRAHAGPTSESA